MIHIVLARFRTTLFLLFLPALFVLSLATGVRAAEPKTGAALPAGSEIGGRAGGERAIAAQSEAKVQAVLFWSTTCDHCHKVIEEVVPGLQARYGDQLNISLVEIQSAAGYDLWRKAWEVYRVPEDRRGVPMLIIGDDLLLGDAEIAQQAPAAIDRALAAGGLSLPPGLGLDVQTASAHHQLSVALLTATPPPPQGPGAGSPASTPLAGATAGPGAESQTGPPAETGEITATQGLTTAAATTAAGSARPALAHALAWIVFAGLVLTAVYGGLVVGLAYFRPRRRPLWVPGKLEWLLPLVAVLGLAVAAYLTDKEVTGAPTFCPVGACDEVQSSAYARLPIPYPWLVRDPAAGSWRLSLLRSGLPVAVLGLVTYILILGLWLWWKYGRGQTKRHGLDGLFALSAIGVLFSIYLTAVELFVLDKVCMWCLASAVAMGLIAWLALSPMRQRLVAVRVRGASVRARAGSAGAAGAVRRGAGGTTARPGSAPGRTAVGRPTAKQTQTGASGKAPAAAGSGSRSRKRKGRR